ncbi:MarR family winged helix-turn-helix transcriptional regulator [Petrocella sp. FN5]|uniref:MarR family winged helix-turn-helix transcriptional regulator n=1 Tax=Petrocella sp. FN5 TaxID=3032002 RepID=UPI0023DCE1B2|nr:MarR family transcriptional regulator [Petrocella sp. FN5]MDF1617076.1 MarR family transcriptional regulator [Petrocella sp. FN5]
MENNPLLLDRQLCFRLYKTSRAIIRIYQPILERIGLTYPQYLVMLVMWEEKKIDFKMLSHRLELKTGTLTPIIQKLEKLGYITKEKQKSDQRKINLVITEKGKEIEKEAQKIPEALSKATGIDYDSYLKYVKWLDELGDVMNEASKKQKG